MAIVKVSKIQEAFWVTFACDRCGRRTRALHSESPAQRSANRIPSNLVMIPGPFTVCRDGSECMKRQAAHQSLVKNGENQR